MVKSNTILAYKLNKENIKTIEKVAKQIDKDIEIKVVDIPEDIIAETSFLVFVDLRNVKNDEDKNTTLESITITNDNTCECIVVSDDTFQNEDKLKCVISRNYKNYNTSKEADELMECCDKFYEKVKEYQKYHSLDKNDCLFSEFNMLEFFDDEKGKIAKYIIGCVKNDVLWNNKLLDYIDIAHRKISPISYKTFNKGIFNTFLNPTIFYQDFIQCEDEEIKENTRLIQIHQLEKLCNIIAEEIYINKYDKNVNSDKLERKLIENKIDVTDEHLIAYRISQRGVFCNLVQFVKEIIENYFTKTNEKYCKNNLFITRFSNELWEEIRIFVRNFASLPLWKNRELAEMMYYKSEEIEEWKIIFETGVTSTGVKVLDNNINVSKMIN